MKTLWDVQSMGDLVAIVFWCAAIWAIAASVFRSFLGRSVATSLDARRQRWEAEFGRATWELFWKVEFDNAWAQAKPADRQRLQKPRDLTEAELAVRKAIQGSHRRWLQGLAPVLYFLTCPLCQHFWVSALLVATCAPRLGFLASIVQAFAYAGGATWISMLVVAPESKTPAQAGGCSCKK